MQFLTLLANYLTKIIDT